ncbi:YIP1 family protein [Haloplasma contractile]|uniref:NHL repeat containing protein n=1 Tax=Haloplasma contractile SSD-17B TaxID=1033810 RepID=U2E9T7_9MOLU|nr:YIP1 family protein [Haloplasma contractile]ERJ11601.1 NHL repeat containing protein [Haloplasma contractile SSD-17B]
MLKNRRIKNLVKTLLVFIAVVLPMFTLTANASPATTYTVTLNSKGQPVRTQDAYLPHRTVMELRLKEPEDIFIDDQDILYIADTGNKRVLKYDINQDEVILELSHEQFDKPRGLFVTESNDIYVADSGAKTIFRFTSDGELIESFGRPTAPSFGDTAYEPMRVAVDNRGNMFIIGQGVYDGVIQLSNSGEFLGYFTQNKVTLSLVERLQEQIFTEEQKESLDDKVPLTLTNIFVDQEGIVYSTTMGTQFNGVKKHNIAGSNIFSHPLFSQDDAIDIYVDEDGIIYAAMKTGTIFVYSSEGDYIYSFGANNLDPGFGMNREDVSGLYSSLATIAVDSQGRIWTADDDQSFLQSYKPTEYANRIYEALRIYKDGRYEEAVEIWDGVLRLNQMSVLAHNNIGKNYLYQQEYEQAMEHFEIAGNRPFYSEAYWEVRNIWLQNNLKIIIILTVVIAIVLKLLQIFDKKYQILDVPKSVFRKVYHVKVIKDFLYMFRVMRHPIDSYYELKKGRKGSTLAATLILIVFFVIFMWYTIGKGFIYQFTQVEDMDFNSIVLGFFSLIFLFIVCNYLVTSINDGEGGLKQIYIMFMYSLAPIMLAMTFITLMSHIMTYNETFFLSIALLIGQVWTFINLQLGIQETHNYQIRTTFKSIALTITFMVILAVVLLIITIMWDQLYTFIETIIKEAIRNVAK